MQIETALFGSALRPAEVVIVDDEPSVRHLMARWLSNAGHHCLEAAEAESAWRILQGKRCDLVTLDIHMPGESGLEMLPRIRRRFPDVEVIVVTAHESTSTAIEALTGGAHGYLIKPIHEEVLLFEVNRALEHRRLILERSEYSCRLEEKLREQSLQIRRAHEETIHRLATAAAYRDLETGAHIKRTGLYSEVFAEALGWSPDGVDNIRMAAPMHDVGKLSIPDAILRKPGALTASEFEIMKGHTIVGAQLLSDSETPILQMARAIALCHHERWDGTGYPKGLAGLEIPEPARIVAIVDAYDALTHDRVYRAAVEEDEAIYRMEQDRGRHFDPVLFSVFLALLPEMRRIACENPDHSLVIVDENGEALDLRNRAQGFSAASQREESLRPALLDPLGTEVY